MAWLTRPLTTWLRLPLWGAVLAGVIALGWLWVGSYISGREESAAIAHLQQVLAAGKAYRATIGRLQLAAAAHLTQAQHAEHGAGIAMVSADSAQKLADSAAAATRRATTAQDSLRTLGVEVEALRGTGASLRVVVDSQQRAIAELRGAYRVVRLEADQAEARVRELESAGHAVVAATACRLVSLHPCIRNIHLGLHAGYGATLAGGSVALGPQVGVAVVWSP